MPKHMRDESNREVRAFVASVTSWPLWVHIDDSVDVYTTAEMSELTQEDPEEGCDIMRESTLCYDGGELLAALRIWFHDL